LCIFRAIFLHCRLLALITDCFIPELRTLGMPSTASEQPPPPTLREPVPFFVIPENNEVGLHNKRVQAVCAWRPCLVVEADEAVAQRMICPPRCFGGSTIGIQVPCRQEGGADERHVKCAFMCALIVLAGALWSAGSEPESLNWRRSKRVLGLISSLETKNAPLPPFLLRDRYSPGLIPVCQSLR
jgi:hypothetical protein